MTGETIELIVEFSVILLSPILHTYCLWKFKKVELLEIKKKYKNLLTSLRLIRFNLPTNFLEIGL